MKALLILIVLGIAGWYAYTHFLGGGPPVIEHPIYGEIRISANVQNRDIEMALFVRASSDSDCTARAQESWSQTFEGCPTCRLQPIKCSESLPPRYAKLFDDVPIASPYLSATAGTRTERDGRVVVYGLTDAEGMQVCELIRNQLASRYKGTSRCIQPSGG